MRPGAGLATSGGGERRGGGIWRGDGEGGVPEPRRPEERSHSGTSRYLNGNHFFL